MKKLHIGGVTMDMMDYAISGNAILGIRDSGKTVTGKGICEQMMDANIPVIVFDAVGKWRWLKTAGDGARGKGYKVVVVGGRKADLPLNPATIGEIIRASIKQNISLVIDFYDKHLTKADWRRIVQESIRIIHYENEGVRHIFLEEAAEYIPQKVMDGQTFAEVEKLVRMGGNASVGITLINPRSQEVNKSVLELCGNLVLGQQIGKNSLEAFERWLEMVSPDIAKEVVSSLPKLGKGEAWVWTRANPDKPSLEKMPMCRSFHPDRRTPESVIETKVSVNTDEFVKTLSTLLPKLAEEKKMSDPVLLQKEIAKLRSELARKEPPVILPTPFPDFSGDVLVVLGALDIAEEKISAAKSRLEELKMRLRKESAQPPPLPIHRPPYHEFAKIPRAIPAGNGHIGTPTDKITSGARRMLIAIAQRQRQGKSSTKNQIGVLAGVTSSGGSFRTYLGALRTKQFVDGDSNALSITQLGLEELGDNWQPLPTGRALYEHWMGQVGAGPGRMLTVLFQAYPNAMTKQELGEASQIECSGGSFRTYLGKLRTLQLVEGKNELKATADFFQ